jgi:hypothetical protein
VPPEVNSETTDYMFVCLVKNVEQNQHVDIGDESFENVAKFKN